MPAGLVVAEVRTRGLAGRAPIARGGRRPPPGESDVRACGTMEYVTRIVIIGGGPGGYEAALVAASLGAEVTVVDCDGLGGASVLTDCVPSKTLIATAEVMTTFDSSYEELGIIVEDDTPYNDRPARVVGVDLGKVNRRVKRLALAQSHDITASVTRAGGRVMRGRGRLEPGQAPDGSRKVTVTAADGTTEGLIADAVLIATGAHPARSPTRSPTASGS